MGADIVDQLRDDELLNDADHHLFDRDDPVIDELYSAMEEEIEAEADWQAKSAANDIAEAAAVYGEEGRTLLVYRGDPTHLWRAVERLEDEDYRYVSTSPERVDQETLARYSILPVIRSQQDAAKAAIPQIDAALSTVKDLDYDDLEGFYEDRAMEGEHLAVGVEEVDPQLSTAQGRADIYRAVADEIDGGEYDTLVYMEQHADTEQIARSVQRGDPVPRNALLNYAGKHGMDIRFVELPIGNRNLITEEHRAEQASRREQEQLEPDAGMYD